MPEALYAAFARTLGPLERAVNCQIVNKWKSGWCFLYFYYEYDAIKLRNDKNDCELNQIVTGVNAENCAWLASAYSMQQCMQLSVHNAYAQFSHCSAAWANLTATCGRLRMT